MNGDINAVSIKRLSYKSRTLLSSLLNPNKVILNNDSDKLPRDWRGLATLVNIPSQRLSDNALYPDKTAKVLEIWQGEGDSTIGQLFTYLQRIDRFDIFDDLHELLNSGQLLEQTTTIVQQNQNMHLHMPKSDLITVDDVNNGFPQVYDAYVLYAKQDQEFANELLYKMREQNFKMCTKHDVLHNFRTQYEPISRLIAERCHRCILIYSPDFLNSPANTFYMDYVQAVGIETRKVNILPCVYRLCELPSNHRYYHKLYYTQPGQRAVYDFWEKLSATLKSSIPRPPSSQITAPLSTQSACKITELPTTSAIMESVSQPKLLALPSSTRSISMSSLENHNSESINLKDESQSLYTLNKHKKQKKSDAIKKFFTKRFKVKAQI